MRYPIHIMRHRMHVSLRILVSVILSTMVTGAVLAEVSNYRYAITYVPGFGSGDDLALGMNDLGHVVGRSRLIDGSEIHAIVWDGSMTRDLGTLGGDLGTANDINNNGWAVGSAAYARSSAQHAFLWKG